MKIDWTLTTPALVTGVGTLIALMVWLLSLAKERASLRVAEVNLRAALVQQMAEVIAQTIADCRFIVASQFDKGVTEVPNFRTVRRNLLQHQAGIRVQLIAYFPAEGQLGIVDAWDRLTRAVNAFNLLASKGEPQRALHADIIHDFIKYAEGKQWLPPSEYTQRSQPVDCEAIKKWAPGYDASYYQIGHVLLKCVYPIAENVMKAPPSPVFALKLMDRWR
ncbi:hypothetical protein BJY21_003858 [Kineosphaera limosa]|uniref:hypothetical protein n=1 Tax=Kineosphaera limosa TaxID=111564 RepID=UPI0012F79BE5|nr:hypothetical protein [Kineosphaera limosa]NYE02674.1 hypothetical protein [Kineosphaera limosa]